MRRVLAVAAALVALGATGTACTGVLRVETITGSSDAPESRAATSQETRLASDLVARVNDERAARGLKALEWDGALVRRAFSWSEGMSRAGLHHSDLRPLLARFTGVAENIGTGPAGTPSGVLHAAWMRSDSHRHDVLAPNLDRVGVGVFCAGDGTMWATQVFGSIRSGDFGPLPAAEPAVRLDDGALTCQP
jgi:uncharacterized protein YkwD